MGFRTNYVQICLIDPIFNGLQAPLYDIKLGLF